ncbi:hypothetical protein AOQ84DRAFT_354055 [Glonium stellatum]|uniref:Uncharacterized protein n=1 Tax=Glonium stellatum TaxID=574774 RepID=A0A8E2F3N3_9PEZI|nr:hypothetical protein AOQ84DRAFT_354055 [Glonium stellatum]
MPCLPFSNTPSSPSNTPKAHPSIVLHTPSDESSPSPSLLFQSTSQTAAAYRNRYAAYLAATFNISLEAAMADMNHQLAPRRASDVSEADAYRS